MEAQVTCNGDVRC